MPFLGDLLSALTDPVGSLYYHWIANLSLLIALVAGYSAVRRGSADRSLAIATGGLLLLRALYALLVLIIMMGGAMGAMSGTLAVVEEGVEAFSVALIAYALSPIPARRNARTVLLLLLAALFIASGLAFALPGAALPVGIQIAWWSGWSLALAVWAVLALLLRRPADWVLALGVALAFLVGHAARLLTIPPPPQPAPTVRLAQLVALPLLAFFAVRRASAPPAEEAVGITREAAPPPEEAAVAEAELQAELERARAEMQRMSLQLQELERRAERDRQLLLEMGKLLEAQLAIPPTEQEAELARLRETLARREAELAALREQLAQVEGQAEARAGAPTRPLNLAAMAAMAQLLRQPLAVIAGYTHLIASESLGPLDPQQKRFLERTEEQVTRLTQLLDDLAQAATPGAAEVPTPEVPASAVEAIEAGISRAGPDMREKRITLKMDIADSLPTPRTDYRTLSEIVSQLISHVCMASPMEGEVSLIAHPEVSPAPSPQEGQWKEGLLIRIWSQVETEPDLSAVAALVEAQGGRIWLESEANARVASVLLPVNGRAG